jgi:hypothetical protein
MHIYALKKHTQNNNILTFLTNALQHKTDKQNFLKRNSSQFTSGFTIFLVIFFY